MNATSSELIQDATDENFDELVLINSSRGPVLVNYWSNKVDPSVRQNPVLQKIAREFAGQFILVNLNADDYRSLANDYGVTSLPTLKLFMKGVVVETLSGCQDESDMKRVLARAMPRESDSVLTEAVRHYQDGDVEKSLVMLAEAALQDPQNLRLSLTMASLLVSEGRAQEALNQLDSIPAELHDDTEVRILRDQIGFILEVGDDSDAEFWQETIAANPTNCAARYKLAALQVLNDDYGEAMAEFYEILLIDPQYRDGVARKALITLFTILGDEHELVIDYRARLQNLAH